MSFVPFSQKYPGEFLSRTEDNFELFLEQLRLFYNATREDIQDGKGSRRKLNNRFEYKNELKNIRANQKGISSKKIASEFNDMLQGCIRHQDPNTAINIIPAPLLASVAGIALTSLYNPNPCWDFLSGKLCLYEKKIVRMLGNLIGWSRSDGFVITGGKQSLAYAIKNGIRRASMNRPVRMNDYVVVCSCLSHYSIEHVCHYLGIDAENCLRVPAHPSGEIDLQAFEQTLQRAISQNKRIATVIAVGGGTIDLIPDPISSIKKSIDDITKRHSLDYTPYLHVDSVITWAWLAFENNPTYFSNHTIPNVSKKIQHVLFQLSGIQYADSFAADFHKTGFCPYAAGVFVAKDSANLAGMTPDGFIPKDNLCFGELEPFRQTFENSRSALAIVSIWIALRTMGLEGLRQYVLYQLDVCELFKQQIRENYSDHFEILNDLSNGWEIVFKPHFRRKLSWDQLQKSPSNEQQEYIDDCHAFLKDLWHGPLGNETQRYPVIGFIRKYSRKGAHEHSFPAFLIHPTSLHYDEREIEQMIRNICEAKVAFDLKNTALTSSSVDEYLCNVVTPR